ncbi:mechanosensitive ion channel [Synechococcus sp. RSCCF101]|uniref:mechanosensitive ion channel family protein n=1 Tax=Synechococcus sp. RSCCF101 TaxID=2511069 RepID=UPI00124439E6|nr:mechanosensitive ion channel domain-containing protein [Synechococcus sp. RSCCF101]QEY31897.1 mechanosensitive ion channel [Synechococcus sp. RSCCF101]
MPVPDFLVDSSARLVLGCLIVWLVTRLLRRVLMGLAQRTVSRADDFVVKAVLATAEPLGYLGVAYWAWQSLPIEGRGDWIVSFITRLLAVVLVVRLVNSVLLRLLRGVLARVPSSVTTETLVALSPLIRTSVWILGALIFLQNQGVQLGAIFATLAGAGIGLGLALQGPVKDFIVYVTILLDKPFVVGGVIRYKDLIGVVERVGVRFTQIRSLDGQRVVVDNTALLSDELQNLDDLPRRRIVHRIGVTYDTPAETVAAIPGMMEEIATSVEGVEFDRAHFISFADSALLFEFVYAVPSSDFVHALDLQQVVNLALLRRFAAEGIQFAFPSQTLYLQQQKTDPA